MKQILCFGDSNTYGLIPGTQRRYGWGTRWTSRLADLLIASRRQVIEAGLCGRTTIFEDPLREGRNGSKVLPVLVQSNQPVERVILMLGTNDCKSYYHASEHAIGGGISLLLDQIRKESANIKILLVSPIHLEEGVWEEGYDPEFNETSVAVSKKLKGVYEEIAKRYGCDFLAASDYVKASVMDREHLDEEGHKRFAEVIYEKIK